MVKRESIFQKLLIYLCLLLVLIVTMVPLVWIISASLKSNNQIFVYPIEWIPRHPKWSNYSTVWQKLPLLTYVRNSAKLTICVTLIQLFTCSFAAYGFAKCRFKGRDRLFILYIASTSSFSMLAILPYWEITSSQRSTFARSPMDTASSSEAVSAWSILCLCLIVRLVNMSALPLRRCSSSRISSEQSR